MTRNIAIYSLVIFSLFCFHTMLSAEQTGTGASSGIRADLLMQVDEVGKKLVALAEAVPAEKYSWRPAEGIRSVSEVYVHVASSNFLLPQFIGVPPPGGLNKDMEKKITDKEKVIAILKQSLEHLRQAILKTPDPDLDKSTTFFGRPATERAVLLEVLAHMHEHLGQSIAYARMNGIVPPWSASPEQTAQSQPSYK